jgi:hypothetical protein
MRKESGKKLKKDRGTVTMKRQKKQKGKNTSTACIEIGKQKAIKTKRTRDDQCWKRGKEDKK